MPMYEYECEICGHKKEVFFHMTNIIPEYIDVLCEGTCTNKAYNSRFKRVYGGGISFKIPEGWGESDYKFDKSPSGKKHVW